MGLQFQSEYHINPKKGGFQGHFNVQHIAAVQTVYVPFSSFKQSWRGQPQGGPPTKFQLVKIDQIGLGADGEAGKFFLELISISVSSAAPPPSPSPTVCHVTEYCCPDAKHCLTPTNVSCSSGGASDCTKDQACCPITKLCVDVGAPCKSPCADQASYCCPDAL